MPASEHQCPFPFLVAFQPREKRPMKPIPSQNSCWVQAQFGIPKFGGMMNRATVNLARGNNDVEHFMDQDELDNLAGRIVAIENFMNANFRSPISNRDICKRFSQ